MGCPVGGVVYCAVEDECCNLHGLNPITVALHRIAVVELSGLAGNSTDSAAPFAYPVEDNVSYGNFAEAWFGAGFVVDDTGEAFPFGGVGVGGKEGEQTEQ